MTTQLDSWLALTEEEAIDPAMPICDPHHHFWDRPDGRYFLDELLKDTGSGHRVAQTVFIECRSMYRQAGPPELQPVGEVEFVQGIAARSASGQYGPTAVAGGIVGHADLMLGDGVTPVLEPSQLRGAAVSAASAAPPLTQAHQDRVAEERR